MSDNDNDKCPQCGKTENIKMICENCGYEYPEEESEKSNNGIGCITLIIAFAIACYYGDWTWLLFFILLFT